MRKQLRRSEGKKFENNLGVKVEEATIIEGEWGITFLSH